MKRNKVMWKYGNRDLSNMEIWKYRNKERKKKTYYFITLLFCYFIIFITFGCTSMQKKNLATENGVISALFNIPESTVESLRTKGLEDEQILKLLIISTATYLTLPEILSMMEDGVSLHEIATDTGIEQEVLQERLDKIKKDLTRILH